MKEFRIEFLKECITRMSDGTMLAIINEYCDSTGNRNIYLNDEDGIEDLCNWLSYDEIFRAISYGSYSYRDTYVWFSAYGNINRGFLVYFHIQNIRILLCDFLNQFLYGISTELSFCKSLNTFHLSICL